MLFRLSVIRFIPDTIVGPSSADSSPVWVWTCCLWRRPRVFGSPHEEANLRRSPCLKSLDSFQETLFLSDEVFTDTGSTLQGSETGGGFVAEQFLTSLLNVILSSHTVEHLMNMNELGVQTVFKKTFLNPQLGFPSESVHRHKVDLLKLSERLEGKHSYSYTLSCDSVFKKSELTLSIT